MSIFLLCCRIKGGASSVPGLDGLLDDLVRPKDQVWSCLWSFLSFVACEEVAWNVCHDLCADVMLPQ